MIESYPRVMNTAAVAGLSIAVASGCTMERYPMPSEQVTHAAHGTAEQAATAQLDTARETVADRFSSCRITKLHDTRTYYGSGTDRVTFSLDLTLRKQAEQPLIKYDDDNTVKWSDDDIVTREAPPVHGNPGSQYSPVAIVQHFAVAPGDGPLKTRVVGDLNPAARWKGTLVDVFKDETTEAAGKTTLRALFCGRMALKADKTGDLTWRLDKNAKRPLDPLYSGTLPSRDGLSYKTQMMPSGQLPR